MKMIKQFSVLLLFTVLAFSCKKKSTPAATPTPAPAAPTTNGSMTAKLNGASWTSTKNTAELAIDTANHISGFVINGETASNLFVFGVDLPTANTNLAVGNHDVGMTLDDVVFIYSVKIGNNSTLSDTDCDQGTLNITSVDNINHKFSGTFSYMLHKIGSTAPADSVKITNGVFTNISFAVVKQ